jgi:hypothetical protein
VEYVDFNLPALAELDYSNLKEVHLSWLHRLPKWNEALSLLKRCTNLRRVTLKRSFRYFLSFRTCQVICDFIMELKQLTFLHIIHRDDDYGCDFSKSLVNRVKAFVLPPRPNFEFYVSCCKKHESPVPGEFMENAFLDC